MEAFGGCDEDGDVLVRFGVLGEGLVPCGIGYVVWFGGIIWQRKFFEALGLCDWIIEYVLKSARCILCLWL